MLFNGTYKTLKVCGLIIGGLLLLFLAFYVKRFINYEVGYSSMVEREAKHVVCSMIKPSMYDSILRDPKVCQ